MKTLFLLALFFSCAQTKIKNGETFSKSQLLKLRDVSGEYNVSKKMHYQNGKLYLERSLSNDNFSETLEKEYMIVKTNQAGKSTFVPLVSQYSTWIDGTEYYSEIKVDPKQKSFVVASEPAGKKYKVPFVNSRIVCPFSFLSDCLEKIGFIKEAIEGKIKSKAIWVIWDSFPHHQKVYEGLSAELLEKVIFTFDGKEEDNYKFSAEVSGQSFSMHYDDRQKFQSMYWITQGLSLTVQ